MNVHCWARRAGLMLLPYSVALALASCGHDSGTGPQPKPDPARLDVVSGDRQTGVAGSELSIPLIVAVRDAAGNPVAGQLVNFRVTQGNGSVFAGSALTNAEGRASERWQLGTSTADSQAVEARAVSSDGQKQVFATFRATATPGAPAKLSVLAGAPPQTGAGETLSDSLRVRVADTYGNPVPGIEVQWTPAANDGTLSAARDTTDARGESAVRWTVGTQVGSDTARASVSTLSQPALFTTAILASVPVALVRGAGDAQRGGAGTALATPLTVKVQDRFGNGVRDATVVWTVTAGGGSLAAASSRTAADGTASAVWTLGTSTGVDSVTASVAGVGAVTFTGTAIAGPPARIVGGTQQTGALGALLPDPLTVTVEDQYGNPVPDAAVDWTVIAGRGTIDPASDTSDAAGAVSARWTLGTQLDVTHEVRATIHGTQVSATFGAVPQLPSDAAFAKVSGDAQSGAVGETLPDSLVVALHLTDGRPVIGATITWSTATGSGHLSSATTKTDETGRGSVAWTLDTIAGPMTATARLAGRPGLTFTAAARAATPAHLIVVGGDRQLGVVGTPLRDSLAVRVTDRYGNVVPGVFVKWTTTSGGSIAPDSAPANTSGIARARWTLGPAAGEQTATASSGAGLSATFTATATSSIAKVVVGTWNTCALLQVGTVACWGSNYFGELGNGIADTLLHAQPARAASGLTFASLSTGGGAVCGLDTSGNAWCWGLNDKGQVGSSTGAGPCAGSAASCVTSPSEIANRQFTTIAPGRTHSCGITTTGDAYCWGDNRYGQLGDGTSTGNGPVLVSGGHAFKSIGVGQDLSCAVAIDGVGYCWGNGSYGALGIGSVTDTCYDQYGRNGLPCAKVPTALAGGRTYTSIDVSPAYGGCGLTTASEAVCWGDNGSGELGDGTTTSRDVPVPVSGGLIFSSISAGLTHSCGLTNDAALYCWGSNRYGELAADTASVLTSFTPRLVGGGATWSAVAAKNDATCALSVDGHVYCWGNNLYGRLGDGSTKSRSVPTLIF